MHNLTFAMLTPTHACLAFLFAWLFSWWLFRIRKSWWSERSQILFVIGSVLPDLPLLSAGFYEFLKYKTLHPAEFSWRGIQTEIFNLLVNNEKPPVVDTLRTNIGYHEISWFLTQILHTYLFWIVVCLLCLWVLPRLGMVRLYVSRGYRLYGVGINFPALRNILPLVCGAVFFHLSIDIFTHVNGVYAYFWPLVPQKIPGFVSPANPWFLKAEIFIWAVWLGSLPVVVYHRLKHIKEQKWFVLLKNFLSPTSRPLAD